MADVIDRGAHLLFDEHRDYNHATDGQYKSLRDQADRLYKKRNELSQLSQRAYQSGDKQKAHSYSIELKKVLNQAESYNRQAAEYVFRENNADSASDEIDLHGLFIKEAEWILQQRISYAIKTNQPHLKVIVGKGLHSVNGISKMKPAVDKMCTESHLTHKIDPHNAGVLIIDLRNTAAGQIPSHWGTSGQGPQQNFNYAPPPQNQGHPHTQNILQDEKVKNGLKRFLIKLVCMCINSK